jgi:CHASE3 domain sensor protein
LIFETAEPANEYSLASARTLKIGLRRQTPRAHAELFEMKIATKLQFMFLAIVAVFILSGVVLIGQMRTLSAGYDAVLASPVHDMDQARVIQVNFKKQVQEWKDTLLRGHTPEDLAKYTKQFHEKEAAVRDGAVALSKTVHDDEARQLLVQFIAADDMMSAKYEAAYQAYVAGHADFKAADKLVRGQDRAPTDLFDKVVARLDTRVKSTIAAQQASAQRNQVVALGVSGGLLALLGLVGFVTVSSILKRLARLQAVSDKLALADVEGLSIDISGKDEIGAFGESMRGVHAAIEELLHAAQAPAAAA